MKQMKFFLVALMAVVMGMSVTSCMNGDDNTQVNDLPVLGKPKIRKQSQWQSQLQ